MRQRRRRITMNCRDVMNAKWLKNPQCARKSSFKLTWCEKKINMNTLMSRHLSPPARNSPRVDLRVIIASHKITKMRHNLAIIQLPSTPFSLQVAFEWRQWWYKKWTSEILSRKNSRSPSTGAGVCMERKGSSTWISSEGWWRKKREENFETFFSFVYFSPFSPLETFLFLFFRLTATIFCLFPLFLFWCSLFWMIYPWLDVWLAWAGSVRDSKLNRLWWLQMKIS